MELASLKGYLPGIIILLVGLPIIWWGTRRPKDDDQNKKK